MSKNENMNRSMTWLGRWVWCGFLGCCGVLAMNGSVSDTSAQGQEPIYDEALVPAYELPPVLMDRRGRAIETAEHWAEHRPQLVALFEEHMFGRRPTTPYELDFQVENLEEGSLPGARASQVRVRIQVQDRHQDLYLLLILPETDQPVPVFLGLNFMGNHTVVDHPDVLLPQGWVPRHEHPGGEQNRASELMRGSRASRWPWPMLVEQGFGLATMYCGDIDEDRDDPFAGGIHGLLRSPGQEAADWGTISAWAWGLSRALDYLESDSRVDAQRVIVIGHSRLGKTALWAGATDPRFAITISNNSGCGGAALSRRRYGESVRRINSVFPHWFNDTFKTYNDREGDLPMDQHQLIACLAPRPVYVASAQEDRWADPRGEFLSLDHAAAVYRLLGQEGLDLDEFPPVDQPCLSRMGYHLRSGGHDITAYDWEQFIKHAQQHLPDPR